MTMPVALIIRFIRTVYAHFIVCCFFKRLDPSVCPCGCVISVNHILTDRQTYSNIRDPLNLSSTLLCCLPLVKPRLHLHVSETQVRSAQRARAQCILSQRLAASRAPHPRYHESAARSSATQRETAVALTRLFR